MWLNWWKRLPITSNRISWKLFNEVLVILLGSSGLPITSNRISWKLSARKCFISNVWVVYRLLQIGLVGNLTWWVTPWAESRVYRLPITSNRISWKHKMLTAGCIVSRVCLPITSNRISWKLNCDFIAITESIWTRLPITSNRISWKLKTLLRASFNAAAKQFTDYFKSD